MRGSVRVLVVPAALVVALLVVGACTTDFDAPFRDTGRTPEPDAAEADSAGPADPRCNFADDYGLLVAGPEAWFRFDEKDGNFVSTGSKPKTGFRKAGNSFIAEGALRSPNGAQHLSGAEGFIGFGDVWPEFNGAPEAAGDRAIELWLRPTRGAKSEQIVFSKIHQTNGGLQGMRLVLSVSGNLRFERYGKTANVTQSLNGGVVFGAWQHLVAQRDFLGFFTFYIDGRSTVFVDNDSKSDTWADSSDAFLVGPFEGDVDELVAYDQTLKRVDVLARLDGATRNGCKGKGVTGPNATTCFGPAARARCVEEGLPERTDVCDVGQSCVMIDAAPRCESIACSN